MNNQEPIGLRRKLFGLTGGILISSAIVILTADLSPKAILIFLPVLMGSLFAGYTIRMNGWLYGITIGVFDSVIVIVVLMSIAPIGIEETDFLSSVLLGFRYFVYSCLIISLGALSGHLGERLAKRWVKKDMERAR